MFIFRYEPSEPINVTILEGTPTILNFTLSGGEISYEQGKSDIDYPRIVPLFNRFPALYNMIMDYDNREY